jgi:heme-degrading monooxygenase HmoA
MFVAINTILCQENYIPRFEELFSTRARAIDTMHGFQKMNVLKSSKVEGEYLVVSYWESEEQFSQWVGSTEFLEGHKRGFEDIRIAKEQGKELPMVSQFHTYTVIAS